MNALYVLQTWRENEETLGFFLGLNEEDQGIFLKAPNLQGRKTDLFIFLIKNIENSLQ